MNTCRVGACLDQLGQLGQLEIIVLVREVRPEEKDQYNHVVTHPLQSWEWGEFRQQTGVEVVRLGVFDGKTIKTGFQITLHTLPKLAYTVGYIPKCALPDPQVFQALRDLGQQKRTLFFKLEPNLGTPALTNQSGKDGLAPHRKYLFDQGCVYGKPLFTKYSFVLDLTQTEAVLMARMKQKTRYNTSLAQRRGVQVAEDNSYQAFDEYLHLTFDITTKRQKFYAHNQDYHKKMWGVLRPAGIAHLLKGTYQQKTLATWIVFIFNNILYYPYGASSNEDRDVMASNQMMWEAIRFGKAQGCTHFDMWGSLGPEANPSDPWFGFHKFKEGYGATLMEFLGTYDFVIDSSKYQLYNMVDKIRWGLLRIKSRLPF